MGQKAAIAQITAEATSKSQEQKQVICKKCGKLFTPYKNGRALVWRICQECMHENRYNRPAENGMQFIISFAEHKQLYEMLLKEAQDQMRTPDKQLLWILKERYTQKGILSNAQP